MNHERGRTVTTGIGAPTSKRSSSKPALKTAGDKNLADLDHAKPPESRPRDTTLAIRKVAPDRWRRHSR
jgi:hypothetical protein